MISTKKLTDEEFDKHFDKDFNYINAMFIKIKELKKIRKQILNVEQKKSEKIKKLK